MKVAHNLARWWERPSAPPLFAVVSDPPPRDTVTVCQEGAWLLASLRTPEAGQLPLERLVALNATLPGLAKICLARNGGFEICAEIPVSTVANADAERLARALVCVEQAQEILQEGEEAPASTHFGDSSETPNVAGFCAENGWRYVERSAGHWMIELEETSVFSQADVTVRGEELRLEVTLVEWDQLPHESLTAVSHLLLTASRTFRMVRAATVAVGARQRAVLIVQLDKTRLAEDLEHALCVLSLATQQLQREVEALRVATIASAYLATCQPVGPNGIDPTTQPVTTTDAIPLKEKLN